MMELRPAPPPVREVVLVRWPEEVERRDWLRTVGLARLLLVGAGFAAPKLVDPLEDWIRLPARQDELEIRIATLASRAGLVTSVPTVDEDGLLRYRGHWIALSPIERILVATLVERFGAVVARETLLRRAWAGSRPNRNALDVHMGRLRRRIAVLDLEVRTVRGRGYLLQSVDAARVG